MKRMMMFALAVLTATACGVTKSPTAPSQADLATTPSASASAMSISVIKDGVDASGNATMTVAIGENYNMGLVTAVSDWNGATMSLVRNCEGKESQVLAEYPNSADPVTGKNRMLFKQIASCAGSVNFRLRATPRGGTLLNFSFPNADRQLILSPAGTLHLVKDAATGFVFVRGNNPL